MTFSPENQRTMPEMTQKAYADSIGVSKQAVGKLVKKGIIILTANGRVDSEQADAARNNSKDPARALVQPDKASAGFTQVRTDRESIKLQLESMKLKQAMGELVSIAEMETAFFNIFRDCRNRLQTLPTDCKGRLVSMTDEREIQIFLSDKIQVILEDISRVAMEKINNARVS